MRHSASHKTTAPLMSILLILSMVLSVYSAATMSSMMFQKEASFTKIVSRTNLSSHKMEAGLIADHGLAQDLAQDTCPTSSDKMVDHCTTCVFISNMVVLSISPIALLQKSIRLSYVLQSDKVYGLSKNVDLSPPQIG